jgi:multicomponent Na+:H+ antiporter subunit F
MSAIIAVFQIALSLAMIAALWRLARGPHLADRVIALDLLASLAVGFLVLRAIATSHWLYVDIALGIGLISVVGTIAFASFIEHRGDEARGRPEDPR